MPHLIEVAFKGNRKEFFLWEGDEAPPPRAGVIVEADRGEDLGRVHATGELAEKRCAGCSHGAGAGAPPERRARRLATPEEEARERELREQDEVARRRAMERVKANGLVMKLSDAEWQFDRKKLTFYFTAERRVDFRALVRELASMFRTRIELKQIGVRDEAKRLDGIGRCGRQYCSSSWLPELRPVNLGVAKDQKLSLNPSQISGACGRLMCCLRYEHEFYVQARKRFPKEGKVLVTRRGEEKVVANDIFNDRVTLRSAEGETRVVLLADLRREMAAGGNGTNGNNGGSAAAAPVEGAAAERTPASPSARQALDAAVDEVLEDDAELEGEEEDEVTEEAAPAARAGERPAAPEGGTEDAARAPRRPGSRRRGRRGGRRGRGGSGGSGGSGGGSGGGGGGRPDRADDRGPAQGDQ